MQRRILLASHGSNGGIAAEQAAIQACAPEDELDHLYVIPSWWRDMTGDDWLNNGVSRNRFRDYLSEQLWQESREVIQRVQKLCRQNKIIYRSLLQVGQSDKSLEQTINQSEYYRIFVGSRRPKCVDGLRDTMLTPWIEKQFANQLHVVAYPNG